MNLIKLDGISFADLYEISDKDVIGMVACILVHGENQCIDVNHLLNLGYQKDEINQTFVKLKSYFQTQRTSYGFLVTNKSINQKDQEVKLQQFWGLNPANISECFNQTKSIWHLCQLLYKMRNHLPQTGCRLSANNDELVYTTALAGDFVNHYQVVLSMRDFEVISLWLMKTRLPLCIFKFCFEESIVSSKYRNFSNQFFDKIIATYDRLNINTLDKAHRFKKERQAYLDKHAKSYVEPQFSNDDVYELTEEDLKIIEGSINESRFNQ